MSRRLAVEVPEEIGVSVKTAAKREGLSEEAWLRRAIEHGLRNGVPRETPLARLAALSAPTADIEAMIAEIEASWG